MNLVVLNEYEFYRKFDALAGVSKPIVGLQRDGHPGFNMNCIIYSIFFLQIEAIVPLSYLADHSQLRKNQLTTLRFRKCVRSTYMRKTHENLHSNFAPALMNVHFTCTLLSRKEMRNLMSVKQLRPLKSSAENSSSHCSCMWQQFAI